MATKKVLGRGLGALLGNDINTPSVDSDIKMINITNINPNSYQPRKTFDEKKLNELANSIKEKGLIQPVILTKKDIGYEIIVGERRWRACKKIGYECIPAIIKEASSYELLELALIENIQREDLNPIEEAKSYKELIDNLNLTQEKLSEKIGKSRASIANTLRLLKLPDNVQHDVSNNLISEGHARTLLSLKDSNYLLDVKELIICHNLSVRQTERLVNAINGGAVVDNNIIATLFEEDTDKLAHLLEDSVIENKKKVSNIEKDIYDFELEGIGKVKEMKFKLENIFNTTVNIKNKPFTNNGKIEIKYKNKDDLRRIISKLGINS